MELQKLNVCSVREFRLTKFSLVVTVGVSQASNRCRFSNKPMTQGGFMSLIRKTLGSKPAKDKSPTDIRLSGQPKVAPRRRGFAFVPDVS